MTSKSLTHVCGTLTTCCPASHFATPRAMPNIPSVAMNGTTRRRVMTTPLTTPTSAPTRMPATTAKMTGSPALMPSAVTTPVSAIVEPTERSIPPLMMMSVMPIAPMATITVCASTMRKLNGERYRAGDSINSEKTRITSARPRTGPTRLSHFWKKPEEANKRVCFASATMFSFKFQVSSSRFQD